MTNEPWQDLILKALREAGYQYRFEDYGSFYLTDQSGHFLARYNALTESIEYDQSLVLLAKRPSLFVNKVIRNLMVELFGIKITFISSNAYPKTERFFFYEDDGQIEASLLG